MDGVGGACRKLLCNTLGAATVMMVAAGEVEVDEAAGRVGDGQKPAAHVGVYKRRGRIKL